MGLHKRRYPRNLEKVWADWTRLILEPEYIIKKAAFWEKYLKILPIIFLLSSIILYFFNIKPIDILINIGLILLLTTMAVWWFWILYTILFISHVIQKSKKNLKDAMDEVNSISAEVIALRRAFNKKSTRKKNQKNI